MLCIMYIFSLCIQSKIVPPMTEPLKESVLKRDVRQAEQYTDEKILKLFGALNTHIQDGKRAPHKPLLVLLALARILREELQPIAYCDVEADLKRLLQRFGRPANASPKPHFPFWRLQHDNIWMIPERDQIRMTASNDPFATDLKSAGAHGQFIPPLQEALANSRILTLQVVFNILNDHFPASRHDDILAAAGFKASIGDTDFRLAQNNEAYEITRRRVRSSEFAAKVRNAYGNQCSVCTFAVAIDTVPIGLEAAHIRWHSHQGPNSISNGIALCSLHHRLFDGGAFSLSDNLKVEVSRHATGDGRHEWLDRFDHKEIHLPAENAQWPADPFIEWHRKEVYRG